MANIIRHNNTNWLDDFWSTPRLFGSLPEMIKNTSVQADMWEENDTIFVKMALPDMEKKDTHISIKDGILTIEAIKSKTEETEQNDKHYYYRSMQSTIKQSFNLPCEVDKSKSKASMENGVLQLTLPKAEDAGDHTIKIQ